jgi:hypothetical protein
MESTLHKRWDLVAKWWQEKNLGSDQASMPSFKGLVLPTKHLNLYAKRLGQQMRLPWISKTGTMGALLLEQTEIIFWQSSETLAPVSGVQFQIDIPVERFKYCMRSAREWHKLGGEVAVEWQEDQIMILDPQGWRLVLRKREEKKI